MYVRAIEVRGNQRRRGQFNNLLATLWALGFTVKVLNPFTFMERILQKKGFEKMDEPSLEPPPEERVVVYSKAPPV